MKVLLVSDETDRYLWDDYKPGNLDGLDLILAAGDLKSNYLSFLVTFANCPLLYVPGNHDENFQEKPPILVVFSTSSNIHYLVRIYFVLETVLDNLLFDHLIL